MRLRAQAGLVLAAAAALVLVLAGCGSSSPHHSASSSSSGSASATTTSTTSAPGPPSAAGAKLTVAPTDGHPTSTVRFTLLTPAASGKHGKTQLSYALSVTGAQRSGCVAQHDGPVVVKRPGEPVAVAVGPAQLGGHWCAGSYTARVDELARPVCGPAQVCPEFIRIVAVIGPVPFRITP